MREFIATFESLFNNAIFYYAIFVMASYVVLALLSAIEMSSYMKKNSYVSYREILVSPLAPSVSILAPAYNEEATIIDNIRSLMSLHYGNYEAIIINDGSTDGTFQRMVDYYKLERVNFAVDYQIKCNEIRGVYKSTLPSFAKLTIVDKVNGGKSDALNAGINISAKDLVLCIDVDCIVEEDALLKLAKPYLEEKNQVIASGGVVRIANSCTVEDGKLVEVHMPKNLWSRFQVLEYIRAFLMGRMAWSKLNGLLIISGAMGLFDKNIVIKVGGYDHSTVGEDMELVVRMRRYMYEQDRRFKVVYIPDPLCWTEAPANLEILGRQRNRWTRGTIETLWMHKDLFFNPRYGILGLLSYPYWFFFEWLAPIIEFVGIIFFIILIVLGNTNWEFSLILLSMVYFFAVTLSTVAILFEEMSYQQYTKGKDLGKLLLAAVLEPILYHPFTVFWAIQGNIHKFTGKNTWGAMTRKGFKKEELETEIEQTA